MMAAKEADAGSRSREPVRVLSVRQPWAWAIIAGHKDIENRSQRTSYRGRVYIHAGLKQAPPEQLELFERLTARLGIEASFDDIRGAVIGYVELFNCTTRAASPWYIRGNQAWHLRGAVAFARPVPLVGRLGLFQPDASDARRVRGASRRLDGRRH
jgi:ASCH domain-containing protein